MRECGLKPVLLAGVEEARTSAMGRDRRLPGREGRGRRDLGGGSLELVEIRGRPMHLHGVSLPLGALMLGELRAGGRPSSSARSTGRSKNEDWGRRCPSRSLWSAALWRALASYAMEEIKHLLTDPHGFELDGKRSPAARQAHADFRIRPSST